MNISFSLHTAGDENKSETRSHSEKESGESVWFNAEMYQLQRKEHFSFFGTITLSEPKDSESYYDNNLNAKNNQAGGYITNAYDVLWTKAPQAPQSTPEGLQGYDWLPKSTIDLRSRAKTPPTACSPPRPSGFSFIYISSQRL